MESCKNKDVLTVAGGDLAKLPATFDDLLDAIEIVESGGDANAVGDNGRAVGAYQIHKIYVDDVNRIRLIRVGGEKRLWLKYDYSDRWSRLLSRGMTLTYLYHYGTEERLGRKPTLEDMARIHNGGSDGWRDDPDWFVRNRGYTKQEAEQKIANTKEYWKKVEKILE